MTEEDIMTTGSTPWRQVQTEALAAMTDAERAEYEAAAEEEETRLHVAELVYRARVSAGLSQTELARRAGTRQAVISSIESGAQLPTISMLHRLARALGGRLHVDIAA